MTDHPPGCTPSSGPWFQLMWGNKFDSLKLEVQILRPRTLRSSFVESLLLTPVLPGLVSARIFGDSCIRDNGGKRERVGDPVLYISNINGNLTGCDEVKITLTGVD